MLYRVLFFILCFCSFIATATERNETVVGNADSYQVGLTADDFVARILFDSLAEEFDLDVSYKNYPTFGEVLLAVESGEVDFAPNATYTALRAESLYFSSPTNIEYIYSFSQYPKPLEEVKSVAVPINTVFKSLVEAQYPAVRIFEFSDPSAAVEWLESNKVEAVVAPINYLAQFAKSGLQAEVVNDLISAKPVSIVTGKKEHQALLNRFVDHVHSTKMQRLLRLKIARYQQELRQVSLREQVAKSGINLETPVSIKLETVYPYSIYQADGMVRGIAADVILDACDILLVECQIVSHEDESWLSMLQQLLNDDIDVLGPMSVSEQRKESVHFSRSFYQPETVLVKRLGYKDNVYYHVSELLAERIGVIEGDFGVEKLANALPQKKLNYFQNQNQLISNLLNDQVDYILMDRTTLNRLLRDKPSLLLDEASSIGAFYRSEVAFGFPKTERGELLASLFSKAINIVDIRTIVDAYNIKPQWRNLYKAEQEYSIKFRLIFICFAMFSGFGLYYLHKQSMTDQLTGLNNRRALSSRMNHSVAKNTQILYLDVNSFKEINDTYGHGVGDQVLKSVASRILRYWPGKAYRVGGDEFVLVGRLTDTQLDTARQHLRSFTLSIVSGQEITVSLSIGTASGTADTSILKDVLKKADDDMYINKSCESCDRGCIDVS